MSGIISSNIVTDGLVFYVDAANPSSYISGDTTTNDLILDNNGTLTNGVGFSTENNGSWTFDGTDDYVNIGTTLGNSFTSITVSAWVNPYQLTQTSGQRYYIIHGDDNSSGGQSSVFNLFFGYLQNATYYSNDFDGQYIIFGVRSTTQSLSTRPIAIADNVNATSYINGCAFGQNNTLIQEGVWVNVVGTYDGSESKVYINGVLSGTSNSQPDSTNRSVSGTMKSSTTPRRISDSGANTDFNGKVSNTHIYNRALSSTEVLHNYDALKGRFGF
jgi:hypothetical protein